ncbi:ribonuclease HI family protein [bacterium]|nr:ribonuclease HI family protein [bacterium]
MSKVVIYTDGASKGNPGDAGIGVVISSPDGTVICEIGEYIGKTTNNVAEYTALIRGLEEASRLGATQIEISTDSQLMARQLSGVYKVKSPNLQPLYAEAVNLIRHFAEVNISHVVRELNKRADELANMGVKKRTQSPKKPAHAKKEPRQRELGF